MVFRVSVLRNCEDSPKNVHDKLLKLTLEAYIPGMVLRKEHNTQYFSQISCWDISIWTKNDDFPI